MLINHRHVQSSNYNTPTRIEIIYYPDKIPDAISDTPLVKLVKFHE